MSAETIFIFTMSLILLWVKPGPGQALKITTTLNAGFIAGIGVVIGIITGCLIFFMIAVAGAHTATNFFDNASAFLKILGGGYLFYTGVKGLFHLHKGQWKEQKLEIGSKSFLKNYLIGLTTNLANPLPIFFFLSIIPTLVPVKALGPLDIVTGALIIILVGLVVDGLLLALVNLIKEALSDTKIITRLNIVTSSGFTLIGLYLIYMAFFQDSFSFQI